MGAGTIFITGAASGIGRETARLFAREGWRVGLCDRDRRALADATAEIGDGASAHPADVTDADALAAAVAAFAGDGPIDALFASAGLLDMRPHRDTPLARQRQLVDVNVMGVLNAIDAALPALRRSRDAHIVSMCSAAAVHGIPDQAVYSATKFFVRGLTEALAIEFERDGICVSDVIVSFVETPMLRSAETLSPSVEAIGVHAGPADVAQTVLAAVRGRQVHWFVSRREAGYARHLDGLPWNERAHLAKTGTGY